jgi:cyclic pyranopterin phosphate synthase
VTDRCNLRCTYCMPEDVLFMPREELLTFEEITSFVKVAVPLGINKIRLTGGEPLMRRHLSCLVEMLAAIEGVQDIGITTNGILLADQAQELFAAGLRRINISLDTLDPERFRQLARRDGLEQVIEGIMAAKKAGFDPVKINAVSIRGITELEVIPLARFAREHALEMRWSSNTPMGKVGWVSSRPSRAHSV